MTFSPFHTFGVKQEPPAMRVRGQSYTTKKLQTRYNIGVQANCIAKGVKVWYRRHLAYHTQSGCVGITLCSPLTIDEK